MKIKTLNRVMASCLAALMAAGTAGCGSSSQPAESQAPASEAQPAETQAAETQAAEESAAPEETAAEETAAPEEEGMAEVKIDPQTGEPFDLGGMEITIADWWTDPDAPLTTEFQEAQKEYRDWLQETYNFTMVQKNYAGWGWRAGRHFRL